MRRSLLAVLLLVGCSSVGVYAPGFEYGVEAAIDAGLPVKVSQDPDAVLQVRARDTLKGLDGHAYDRLGCMRRAYAKTGEIGPLIAHEIGHLLGLNHVDGDRNLMNATVGPDNVEVTSEQRKRAKQARGVLKACEVIQ